MRMIWDIVVYTGIRLPRASTRRGNGTKTKSEKTQLEETPYAKVYKTWIVIARTIQYFFSFIFAVGSVSM